MAGPPSPVTSGAPFRCRSQEHRGLEGDGEGGERAEAGPVGSVKAGRPPRLGVQAPAPCSWNHLFRRQKSSGLSCSSCRASSGPRFQLRPLPFPCPGAAHIADRSPAQICCFIYSPLIPRLPCALSEWCCTVSLFPERSPGSPSRAAIANLEPFSLEKPSPSLRQPSAEFRMTFPSCITQSL